jgi:hypothetical protein
MVSISSSISWPENGNILSIGNTEIHGLFSKRNHFDKGE